MDTERKLYGKVVGDTAYLLLMMAVVFFAGTEYSSNSKHAWSSLALVGFSIAGLVWRELTLLRKRLQIGGVGSG